MGAIFGILNPGGSGTAVRAAQDTITPLQMDPYQAQTLADSF